MDVYIILFTSNISEEAFPKRGKMEIRVGQEEKGDFGSADGGREVGFG